MIIFWNVAVFWFKNFGDWNVVIKLMKTIIFVYQMVIGPLILLNEKIAKLIIHPLWTNPSPCICKFYIEIF